MILTPPIALTLSIIGLVKDAQRTAAIAGVIISVGALATFFVLPLILSFCF